MGGKSSNYFPVVTCVTSAILLAGFGLVCLYSALRGNHDFPAYLLNKQILLLGVAVVFATFVALARGSIYQKTAYWGMALAMLGLILVLVPGIGVKVNGARRWMDFGISNFQISEISKGLFVLGFAQYLSAFQKKKGHFIWGFAIPMSMIVAFVGVILLEPDYGTAFLFGIVGVTMLFLWGAKLYWLIPTNILGCTVVGWLIYNDPVRWKRVISFIAPEKYKDDAAYQLYQGMLAYGSGGIMGLGIGNGRQQQAYLPEAHTDFILSVVAEEMGMVATMGIVAMFAVLFWSIIRIAKTTNDMFWFLVVVGGGCFIVYQSLFNIGVVTGSMPTKGISLPFISYGGANMVGSFFIIGLLMCAWRQSLVSPISFKVREI